MSLDLLHGGVVQVDMAEALEETAVVELTQLGERLSALRLCEPPALLGVRRSLEQHGQLVPLLLFVHEGRLEILDGFKRVRAARALGWSRLRARIDDVGPVDAKLRLREVHGGRPLCELEEAWLVRALYRDDRMSLPQIASRLGRHRSWVWRRLMFVESLDKVVQNDVRLGLLVPRAAVAVSRLPRGNQQATSEVVIRLGLTVRQTDLLVTEVLAARDPAAREALIARRLEGPASPRPPGPRPSRALRSEADYLSADILRVREISARLEARLLATPLEALTPAAAELMRDALVRLVPVLRALDDVIGTVTGVKETA
jgi:ParB-like chromosome segregation protein Spo0J